MIFELPLRVTGNLVIESGVHLTHKGLQPVLTFIAFKEVFLFPGFQEVLLVLLPSLGHRKQSHRVDVLHGVFTPAARSHPKFRLNKSIGLEARDAQGA
jgi:hypothetical protein